MMELTPGQWQLGEREAGDESGGYGIGEWDGTIISILPPSDDPEQWPTEDIAGSVYNMADARAMAAAKDLLEALIAMVDMHACWNFPCDAPTCVHARDVIAKARGTEEHICRTITVSLERT